MSSPGHEFLDPKTKADLELQFGALDKGISVTPTQIRALYPVVTPEVVHRPSPLAKLGSFVTSWARRLGKDK